MKNSAILDSMKLIDNKVIIDILTDFATEILIINENISDIDKLDKEELKIKKLYAKKIVKARI